MRTAIYTRLSKDRAGQSANVAIQEAECRAYAAEQGWPVAGIFSDNDISASRYSRKPRPGYQALLSAIRDGQVEAVLVVEVSRLYRRMDELLELIDLAERTPLRKIETTDQTGYDLSTGQGIHAAHTAVSTAWLESRKISDRAKRKKLAQAKEGRYAGGPACYGYRWMPATRTSPGHLDVDPDQAAVIWRAAKELLAGRTLRAVAAGLNRDGYRTTTGALWRPSNLKRVMVSHRIAGVRVHKGIEYPGTWTAILDRDTWEQVRLILTAPARYVGASRKGGRTYLLTGLIFCGRCGQAMVGAAHTNPNGVHHRRYVCKKTADTGQVAGCGGLARIAEPVDALVEEAVLQVLDSDRMADVLAAAADTGELAGLMDTYQQHKLKLDGLVDDYATGLLNREQLARAKAVVEDAMEALQRRMAKLSGNRTVASVPPGQSFRKAWADGDLDFRRSLVALVLERVVLHPGRAGAHRWSPSPEDPRSWNFDPRRVELRWKN